MDFRVGERVRFLHEKQEGVVQELLPRNKLLVLVDDFLDIEVSNDEVVRIHGAEVRLGGSYVQKETLPEVSRLPKDLSIAICKNSESDYDILIINPGPDKLLFAAYAKIRVTSKAIGAGTVSPKKYKLLGQLSTDEFHHAKALRLQLMFFPVESNAKPRRMRETELLLRIEVTETIPSLIPGIEREGYLFPLFREEIEEASQESKSEIQKAPEPDLPPDEEVDLHIQKLVRTISGLSPDAILQIQLTEFNLKLDAALKHGMKKMVFIHGVGSGTLKLEIHRQLRDHERVASFEMGDPLEYGNGATIALIN